jgi:hypothetical protein
VSVLYPDRTLGVRRRDLVEDDLGDLIPPTGTGTDAGAFPGRAREQQDGSWRLALDPRLWPVRENDVVYDQATGQSWVVRETTLLTNHIEPVVDYIRIVGAEMRVGGAEPRDPWFVGRSDVPVGPPT